MLALQRDLTDISASTPHGVFIDNDWRETAGSLSVIDPASGAEIARTAAGTAVEIDVAVTSARRALDGPWKDLGGRGRAELLFQLAQLIDRDSAILARLEAVDIAKPITQAARLDVPQTAATFRYFAGLADKIGGQTIPTPPLAGRASFSYTIREPIGVIGAIVPWNAPTMITAWKLAPALAAGNTVVLKPPEDAPLTILHLAELIREAGFPPGTVNIVPGTGLVAGGALVAHPGVDKISFTGSPDVGRQIQIQAAPTFKRLTLELGGKSPQIIFPDADLSAAIQGTANGLFFNQGQVCAAGTRVLVHRSCYEEVTEGLVRAAGAQILGDPLNPETTMGALINAKQRDRVVGYIHAGIDEGATLAYGGTPVEGPGFYVSPTVFAGVDNGSTIAQEEIFGPVGSVIPFDSPDEAVQLANATRYGLAATIWTNHLRTAHQVSSRLQVGSVSVNGWGSADPALPWGGLKTSGIGRERGWSGVLADTEEKVVTIFI